MKRAIGIITALMIVTGCATRKEIIRFQEDVALIQDRLTAVQRQNDRLNQEIQQLRKELAESREEQKRLKADLLTELGSFKDLASFLRYQLEETGFRMSRIVRDLESSGARKADSSASSPKTEEGNLTPKALYDAAYLDLVKKNHTLALQGFHEYLRRFPESEYADNAQYWIGEIFYANRDYAQALQEFEKVLRQYPKGKKVPAAMLKMGYCLMELNRKAEAISLFEELIRRFPLSEEASLAHQRLEILKR